MRAVVAMKHGSSRFPLVNERHGPLGAGAAEIIFQGLGAVPRILFPAADGASSVRKFRIGGGQGFYGDGYAGGRSAARGRSRLPRVRGTRRS
ncbi:MAG: hypothetical protein R2716_05730 [Microthrixaceae bacterium]